MQLRCLFIYQTSNNDNSYFILHAKRASRYSRLCHEVTDLPPQHHQHCLISLANGVRLGCPSEHRSTTFSIFSGVELYAILLRRGGYGAVIFTLFSVVFALILCFLPFSTKYFTILHIIGRWRP